MRRGSRFLIGFAAAALTFGSLNAFVGHRQFGRHRHHFGRGHHCQTEQGWSGRHGSAWEQGKNCSKKDAPAPSTIPNKLNNKNQ
jgi:hypothetical protein